MPYYLPMLHQMKYFLLLQVKFTAYNWHDTDSDDVMYLQQIFFFFNCFMTESVSWCTDFSFFLFSFKSPVKHLNKPALDVDRMPVETFLCACAFVVFVLCFFCQLKLKLTLTQRKENVLLCRHNQLTCQRVNQQQKLSVWLYLNVAFIQDPAQPTFYPECI